MAKIVLLIAILASLLSSCAPQTAYLSGKVDPSFIFDKAQPIYLGLRNLPTIEDKQFHHLVLNEMKLQGFTVVDSLRDASLALYFGLDDEATQIETSFSFPSSSTTSGTIGNQTFHATTQGTQIVPSSIPYTVKRIHLFLFKIDKKEKKGDLVWEGYLGAGAENFSSNALTATRQILNVVGRNFEGNILLQSEDIPPSVNPATHSISQAPKIVQLEEEVRTLQEQNQSLQKQLDQSYDSKLVENSAGSRNLTPNMSTLEKECEKESYQACANVGFYYDIGKGVPVNPELAAAFYKRGCDGNNAQACTGLGMLYKNGRGVEGDKSRAKVLLTKRHL
jgi:Sel1 repeat